MPIVSNFPGISQSAVEQMVEERAATKDYVDDAVSGNYTTFKTWTAEDVN